MSKAKVATVICNVCGSDLVSVLSENGASREYLCAYCLSEEQKDHPKEYHMVATLWENEDGQKGITLKGFGQQLPSFLENATLQSISSFSGDEVWELSMTLRNS